MLVCLLVSSMILSGCGAKEDEEDKVASSQEKSNDKEDYKADEKKEDETESDSEKDDTIVDSEEEANDDAQQVDTKTAAAKKLGSGNFDLEPFTQAAGDYVDQVSDDIDASYGDDDAYFDIIGLSMVTNDDLMAIVNIELEYLMEMNTGTWENKESLYPNGKGKSLSSMALNGDVYEYNISYQDNSGSHKEIVCRYNSALDRLEYMSKDYNDSDVLMIEVWQQYCNDGSGGYYYQTLRHHHLDGLERAAFQYFNGNDYRSYIKGNTEGQTIGGLVVNIFEEMPNSPLEMIAGLEAMALFENKDGVLTYQGLE